MAQSSPTEVTRTFSGGSGTSGVGQHESQKKPSPPNPTKAPAQQPHAFLTNDSQEEGGHVFAGRVGDLDGVATLVAPLSTLDHEAACVHPLLDAGPALGGCEHLDTATSWPGTRPASALLLLLAPWDSPTANPRPAQEKGSVPSFFLPYSCPALSKTTPRIQSHAQLHVRILYPLPDPQLPSLFLQDPRDVTWSKSSLRPTMSGCAPLTPETGRASGTSPALDPNCSGLSPRVQASGMRDCI